MNALANYLNDHLAGARAALALTRRLAQREEDTPLGHFLKELGEQIDADRGALEQVMELLQIRTRRLRQGMAWLGEKVFRVALGGNAGDSDLQRLQELEILALGVEGKRALWGALRQVAVSHPNLRGVDLDHLARRADEQRQQIESWRLTAAVTAFPAPQEREPAPIASPQTE